MTVVLFLNDIVDSASLDDPDSVIQDAHIVINCTNCVPPKTTPATVVCEQCKRASLCDVCSGTIHRQRLFATHKPRSLVKPSASATAMRDNGSRSAPATAHSPTVTPLDSYEEELNLALAVSASLADMAPNAAKFVKETTGMRNSGVVCFAIGILLALFNKPELASWMTQLRYGQNMTIIHRVVGSISQLLMFQEMAVF